MLLSWGMGHDDVVAEILVDAGFGMDALNCNFETPIRQAILLNHIEVVQLLHQRGAGLMHKENRGTYAL